MKRVLLQPAFVLHRRAYRESSFLVELFTPEYGRLTAIARGVRKAKSSTQALLQPFIPVLASWSGHGDLMMLTGVEAGGVMKRLQGDCLFAGFYLNELLMRLLHRWDAQPGIYDAYAKTVTALQTSTLEQKSLRAFEKYLLEELGYGLLAKSSAAHSSLLPDKYYRFVPEQGFVVSEIGDPSHAKGSIFSGKSLLAIANEEWDDNDSMQDAKRLTRFLLAPLLGVRPLFSRKLFMQPEGENKNDS